MGLESATYVNQLNSTNPIGAVDPKSQGDDHLRLIKSTLLATFPNLNGAMTATPAQLNGIITPTVPANKVKGTGVAGAGVAATVLHSDAQILIDLTDAFAWTGQHSWSVALRAPAGVVGTPAYSFAADTDTGIWNNAANSLGFSVGGALAATLDANALTMQPNVVFRAVDGSVSTPSISFGSDTNTGLYRIAADRIGIAAGGVNVMDMTNTFVQFAGVILAPDGIAGTPGYTFGLDQDTGIYRAAANSVGFAAAGTLQFYYDTSSIISRQQNWGINGAAATPTYAFESDTNTGVYRIAADQLGFSENGIGFRIGFRNIPQNSQSANYTCVIEDTGKHIYHASGAGAGDIYTIPANASVAYDIGTVLTFINDDSNSVSIAITTDTLALAGTALTGTRTLAANGIATAIKTTATRWLISGPGVS